MSDQHSTTTYDIEIALLKQRIDSMEDDVKSLDNDIKSLRSEMKDGFDKVIEKFDSLHKEMVEAKSFGRGVYSVVGGVVAVLVTFKDQLLNLIK